MAKNTIKAVFRDAVACPNCHGQRNHKNLKTCREVSGQKRRYLICGSCGSHFVFVERYS